ncbi:MAG: TIGR04255 family protein [Nitrospira sp.]|nr:TIGR04255 family protein [Nitrospira sp.]
MTPLPDPNTPLPEFDNPPVIEVALSVQFDTLANLRTPQIGVLWQEFRDRFPKTEEHPPLESAIERFGVSPTPKGVARFQLLSTPPAPRCWFLNEEGTELVQVQHDRFVHNWRKVGDNDTYPRYDHVRATFESELKRFSEVLLRQELGELHPNQCEITYVNHIVSGEGWTTHGQLGDIVNLFSLHYTDAFHPEPEDCRLAARFVIPNRSGEPVGRLHVAIEPVYRTSDDAPMFALTLTARGRPLSYGLSGVLEVLDLGREWIVRTFATMTTPKMHALWRRKQ